MKLVSFYLPSFLPIISEAGLCFFALILPILSEVGLIFLQLLKQTSKWPACRPAFSRTRKGPSDPSVKIVHRRVHGRALE